MPFNTSTPMSTPVGVNLPRPLRSRRVNVDPDADLPEISKGEFNASISEAIRNAMTSVGGLENGLMQQLLTAIDAAVKPVVSTLVDKCYESFSSYARQQSHELDNLDQNSRSLNLCFHGLEESEGEQLETTISKFVEDSLKVKLPVDSIVKARRIGKPAKRGSFVGDGKAPGSNKKLRPRPVVVTFSHNLKRSDVFYAKKHLAGTGKLITEDLTPHRRELYQLVAKEIGIRKTWTTDGRVRYLDLEGRVHTATSIEEFRIQRDPVAMQKTK